MKKFVFAGSVVISLFASFVGQIHAGDATLTLDDNAGSSSFVVQDVDKTNQFKVNSDGQGYFAGNVGIGVTVPSANLHVKNSGDARFILEGGTTSDGGLFYIYSGGTLIGRIRSGATSSKSIYLSGDGSTDHVSIKSDGKVGIGTTDPKSTLHNAGSLTVKRVTTDGHYYLTTTDYIVAWTTLITTRIAYLPAAATAGEGRIYIIKDETGNAGTYSITIQPSGSETIDGAATKVINTAYGSVRLYSNGANWFTW